MEKFLEQGRRLVQKQKKEKTEGATGLDRITKRADRKMESNDSSAIPDTGRHQKHPASLLALKGGVPRVSNRKVCRRKYVDAPLFLSDEKLAACDLFLFFGYTIAFAFLLFKNTDKLKGLACTGMPLRSCVNIQSSEFLLLQHHTR